MDHAQHGNIVSFIWNIADDVLRDVYVRGKYSAAIPSDARSLPRYIVPGWPACG